MKKPLLITSICLVSVLILSQCSEKSIALVEEKTDTVISKKAESQSGGEKFLFDDRYDSNKKTTSKEQSVSNLKGNVLQEVEKTDRKPKDEQVKGLPKDPDKTVDQEDREKFEATDTNKDGQISKNEMHARVLERVQMRMGADSTEQDALKRMDDFFERMWDRIQESDIDGNEQLDYDEMSIAREGWRKRRAERRANREVDPAPKEEK